MLNHKFNIKYRCIIAYILNESEENFLGLILTFYWVHMVNVQYLY